MRGNIIFKSKKSGYKELPDYMYVDLFEFLIDGKPIEFCWKDVDSEFKLTKKGYIIVDVYLDRFYSEDYEIDCKKKYRPKAKYLAGVDKIVSIDYSCYKQNGKKTIPFKIKKFTINDWLVRDKVIKEFNKTR